MFCPKCGARIHEASQFCASCGTRLSDLAVTTAVEFPGARVGTPASAERVDLYSGFWRRVAAYVIDYLVVLAASIAAAVVTIILGLSEQAGTAVIYMAIFIFGWLYSALMESSAKQATLGKLALGIKVTNLQGERIGFGRATGRYFGMILSSLTFFIGFVMAGFTRRRQALHDMVAGTLVVKRYATPEQLAAHPEAAAVSMWTIIPLVLLAAVLPVTGILAAIAIPAYQDYTIRVQVTDGLMAASQYKAAVAEAVASNMAWDDINSDSLGLSPTPSSNYLQSIEVVGGVVVLTYGQQANGKIADAQLLLVPGVTQDGDVIWTCGFGKAPSDAELPLSEYEQYTSVERKYLPSSCRE